MKKIDNLGNRYFEKVVALRRHFHQYPELSGNEKNSADKICQILDSLQIPYQRDIGGHGVVALVSGHLPTNRVVALRADMDALPIQEISTKPYISTVDNVMHACGHDAHTAMLLGTLMILNDLKEQFGGTVKAIFQPSEEEYPGGAIAMIQQGVLHEPEVDVIFAQHVTPEIETGRIGICEGAFMASTDEIHITIKGKGGHAALPHEYINPVAVGIELLTQINNEIEINKPKNVTTVLAFGKFIANGLTNLIPETATIAGTFRTFDENWRQNAHQLIETVAQKVSSQFQTSCFVDIRKGYPVLVNDISATQRVKHYAELLLGKENVLSLPQRTTAEDFAYFLQQKPGIYYRLGTKDKMEKKSYRLHSNQFDIDEKSLLVGIKLMSWIAINELQRK